MTRLRELLLESAPLAYRLAPQLCRADPATGEDCSAAHGVWQYLKLMGLTSTPETRRGFYLDAMQAIGCPEGAPGRPRVLISGTADYTMLDFVLTAFGARRIVPDITVADLCETPLELNRWYAGRASAGIQTVRSDVLALEETVPFDAVCTDYFLSKFPAARRGGLLEKWRRLLRPGGVVITATRLRPASEGETARFTPEQVEKLRAEAARIAREMPDLRGVDPEELAGRVAAFAAGYLTHAVHTRDEVRALFEGCGFEVDQLSVRTPPSDGAKEKKGLSGPTVQGDTKEYLTVLARRA